MGGHLITTGLAKAEQFGGPGSFKCLGQTNVMWMLIWTAGHQEQFIGLSVRDV